MLGIEPGAENAVCDVELDLPRRERPQHLGQFGEGPAAVADIVDDQEVALADRLAVHNGPRDGAGVGAAGLFRMHQRRSGQPGASARALHRAQIGRHNHVLRRDHGNGEVAGRAVAHPLQQGQGHVAMGVPYLDGAVALRIQQPAGHGGGQCLPRVGHAVLPGVGQIGAYQVDRRVAVMPSHRVGQQQKRHQRVAVRQVGADRHRIGRNRRCFDAHLDFTAGKAEAAQRDCLAGDGEGQSHWGTLR